ncbi:hypothetical protein J6590_042139 [Homalodisca vitripennis]|nr:hypothetical protein J6590_042139 [Homalodisca vitripennis]
MSQNAPLGLGASLEGLDGSTRTRYRYRVSDICAAVASTSQQSAVTEQTPPASHLPCAQQTADCHPRPLHICAHGGHQRLQLSQSSRGSPVRVHFLSTVGIKNVSALPSLEDAIY